MHGGYNKVQLSPYVSVSVGKGPLSTYCRKRRSDVGVRCSTNLSESSNRLTVAAKC